jgi:hypothetical protein
MKGFAGITDNDWVAHVALLKQVWPKAQGLRLKAIRTNQEKGKHVQEGGMLIKKVN